MTYVVVGASSGLGRALAEEFAAAGHDLVIVSSDKRDLLALASDLTFRNSVRIVPVEADLGGEDSYLRPIVDAVGELGNFQGLLFPVGASIRDDDLDLAPAEAARLVRVNFLCVSSIILSLLPLLRSRPGAVIVGFGSISATRGRDANMVYAAAKRGLESYFESLRHAFSDSDVLIQFYVLGYLETNLSFGIPTMLPKGDVGKAGACVLANITRDFGVAYYPRFWRYICPVVRMMPWFVFKHLKF